jgi:hypothetical protein
VCDRVAGRCACETGCAPRTQITRLQQHAELPFSGSWEGLSCETRPQTEPPTYKMTDAPTIPPTEKMCAAGCLERWLGDKKCDRVCMSDACRFDDGDCASVPTDPPVEVCSCPLFWLGDKTCNIECNTEACKFDRGDCDDTNAPVVLTRPPTMESTGAPSFTPIEKACSPACQPEWLGDGSCQIQCHNADCRFDGGDCPRSEGWCAARCSPDALGDGFCDSECNSAACNWDNSDCRSAVNPLEIAEPLVLISLDDSGNGAAGVAGISKGGSLAAQETKVFQAAVVPNKAFKARIVKKTQRRRGTEKDYADLMLMMNAGAASEMDDFKLTSRSMGAESDPQLEMGNCGSGPSKPLFIGIKNDGWYGVADFEVQMTMVECSNCTGVSCSTVARSFSCSRTSSSTQRASSRAKSRTWQTSRRSRTSSPARFGNSPRTITALSCGITA